MVILIVVMIIRISDFRIINLVHIWIKFEPRAMYDIMHAFVCFIGMEELILVEILCTLGSLVLSWLWTPEPPDPTNATNTTEPTVYKIFYQNQFFHSYKTDERIIKNIIANNVQCYSNKSDTSSFHITAAIPSPNSSLEITRALPPHLSKKLT